MSLMSGNMVDSCPLSGVTALLVEDEPLIALHIGDILKGAGAAVLVAHTVSTGMELANHPDLTVGVIDLGLSDGEGSSICERLKERGVPFVLHSGYGDVRGACHSGIVLPKPATPEQLIASVVQTLRTN